MGSNSNDHQHPITESKQPFGERAKQALSDLAYNKPARVVVQDTDRYGRTVGRVYVGGLDVNAEMVERGAAWVYRTYAVTTQAYPWFDQFPADHPADHPRRVMSSSSCSLVTG